MPASLRAGSVKYVAGGSGAVQGVGGWVVGVLAGGWESLLEFVATGMAGQAFGWTS